MGAGGERECGRGQPLAPPTKGQEVRPVGGGRVGCALKCAHPLGGGGGSSALPACAGAAQGARPATAACALVRATSWGRGRQQLPARMFGGRRPWGRGQPQRHALSCAPPLGGGGGSSAPPARAGGALRARAAGLGHLVGQAPAAPWDFPPPWPHLGRFLEVFWGGANLGRFWVGKPLLRGMTITARTLRQAVEEGLRGLSSVLSAPLRERGDPCGPLNVQAWTMDTGLWAGVGGDGRWLSSGQQWDRRRRHSFCPGRCFVGWGKWCGTKGRGHEEAERRPAGHAAGRGAGPAQRRH
jgi:hypothetical protein